MTTEGQTTTRTTAWTSLRETIRARRDERAAYRALARELGAYRTPSERIELEAILSRYDGPEVDAIHRIIERQAA